MVQPLQQVPRETPITSSRETARLPPHPHLGVWSPPACLFPLLQLPELKASRKPSPSWNCPPPLPTTRKEDVTKNSLIVNQQKEPVSQSQILRRGGAVCGGPHTEWLEPFKSPSFSSLRRPGAQVNKPLESQTSQAGAGPSSGLASQRKVAIALFGPHTLRAQSRTSFLQTPRAAQSASLLRDTEHYGGGGS